MEQLIINLSIFEQSTVFSGTWFEGESPEILIDSNVPELQDEPVIFYGETKVSIIKQVKSYLHGKGLSGIIRINKSCGV